MLKKALMIGSLATLAFQAQGRGLDVSLSSETAYFKYLFDSTNVVQGGADISAGFFYNDKEEDGLDIDTYLGTVQFLVTGNLKGSQKRVKLSAGAKAYAGTIDDVSDTDIGALAVGGRAAYIIPNESTPMSVYLEGFIAPNITSFLDVEDVRELTLGFEAEIAPSAKGYIGYRLMEVEFENRDGDIELDDNIHIGVQFTF